MTTFYYSSINDFVVFGSCNEPVFGRRNIFFSLKLFTHIKQWDKSKIKYTDILKAL